MSHTNAWGYKLLPLKNGREWEIVDDYTYRGASFHITVEASFVYNGASIPRMFWRVIGPPMAGKYAHATLLHDWLYRNKGYMRGDTWVSISRERADEVMLEVMREDDVSWWRRNAIHRGVRAGGGKAWRT